MAECEGRGELRRQIEAIEVIAARLDEDIDFLVWDLSPAVLDDLGLHAALASYVRNWSTHFGISAELQARGFEGDRLRPEIETTLYRIAQEALTNIVKHARAAKADVILDRRADHADGVPHRYDPV